VEKKKGKRSKGDLLTKGENKKKKFSQRRVGRANEGEAGWEWINERARLGKGVRRWEIRLLEPRPRPQSRWGQMRS